MQFADTHSHLHFDSFGSSRQAVYESALAAGVSRIICVGTALDDSLKAAGYAAKTDGIWAAAGVHPHEAAEYLDDKQGPARLAEILKMPKVVATGEIGLDYYKSATPKDIQEKALRSQLEAGLEAGKPFSFHVRDAFSDFWRIVDDYSDVKGVVHSFSSGRKQLDAALSRGFYIGLNGIMTFTRDQAQLEAARRLPLERLLLETDAPFLTPEPFRGQVCEPKYTVATAEFLARLRDEPLEQLAAASTKNAIELFGL
jgi:TatD DNase family protein